MTYYGSKELADALRTVRKNTIIIAEEIPEEHYIFQVAPEARTVAQLLIHISVIPRVTEQIHFIEKRTTLEGFDFFSLMATLRAEEQVKRSKEEILGMLSRGGDHFAQLLEKVPEDALAQTVTYPQGMTPPAKSRFEMLLGTKEHEMHHRGQLMLMERMLGIVLHLTRHMQSRMAAIQQARGQA